MEILLVLTILLLILEFSTIATYGWYIKDEVVFDYLYEFEPFEKNPFDNKILGPVLNVDGDVKKMIHRAKNGKYISHTPFSPLSKYHISGKGPILRWTEAHKVINNLYKTTKIKQYGEI